LLSYGADPVDTYRRAGTYVDRILRGEKPGDLPVQFPTKFEMIREPQDRQGARCCMPLSIRPRADETIK
jgi:putative ABC transport system substrate-binding protein